MTRHHLALIHQCICTLPKHYESSKWLSWNLCFIVCVLLKTWFPNWTHWMSWIVFFEQFNWRHAGEACDRQWMKTTLKEGRHDKLDWGWAEYNKETCGWWWSIDGGISWTNVNTGVETLGADSIYSPASRCLSRHSLCALQPISPAAH